MDRNVYSDANGCRKKSIKKPAGMDISRRGEYVEEVIAAPRKAGLAMKGYFGNTVIARSAATRRSHRATGFG
jgi:hypothetical protein